MGWELLWLVREMRGFRYYGNSRRRTQLFALRLLLGRLDSDNM